MLATGQRCPEFELPELPVGTAAAGTFSSNRLPDHPTLLVFFKVSCPTCQLTLPFLNRLQLPGGFSVVSISQDNQDLAARFREQFRIEYPILLDTLPGYPVSNQFRITNVPSMFLIGPDGSIEWSSQGFNRSDLQALGEAVGVTLFRPEDRVPEWKPG